MAIRLHDEWSTLILHPPKTAGTFILRAVQECGLPHSTPEAIGGQCPKHGTARNYGHSRRIVTVVRHPCDWIESWWRYHYGGPPNPRGWSYHLPYWSEIGPVHSAAGDDFGRLVMGIIDRCPGAVSRLFDLYVRGADVVLRQETLEAGLAPLLGVDRARLNRIPRQNVSRQERVPIWPAGTREAFVQAEDSLVRRYYR